MNESFRPSVPSEGPPWLSRFAGSISDLFRRIMPTPFRPKDYTTSGLPAAADWKQGIVYDSTLDALKVSNGTDWIRLSAYDADVAAYGALTTTGLVARTGDGTAATRTITGTADEISVANGDGVAGNPTLSLPTALTFTGKTVTGGAFNDASAIGIACTPVSGVVFQARLGTNRRVSIYANGSDNVITGLTDAGGVAATMFSGSPATLAHAGVAKATTSATGIAITGLLTATGVATFGTSDAGETAGTSFITGHLRCRNNNTTAGLVSTLILEHNASAGGQVYLQSELAASAFASFVVRVRTGGGMTERLRIANDGATTLTGALSATRSDGGGHSLTGLGWALNLNSSNSNDYKVAVQNAGATVAYWGANSTYCLLAADGSVNVRFRVTLAATPAIHLNTTQVLTTRRTGWATATGTATRTTFDTTTVTTAQLAERVKALIDDLHGTAGHGLIGT